MSVKHDNYEEFEVADDPRAGLLGDNENNTEVSSKQKSVARAQFYALCWSFFLLGWIDGSTGPLLPRIQEVYGVGFASLTWIFVLQCGGIIFGALVNMPLSDRFGFGKILVFASVLWMIAFSVQSLALPYPFFVLSFLVGGIGIALEDAHANAFIALLRNDSDKKMGLLHATYGAGALVAPLSATHFAETTNWSYHYLISLAFGASNCLILAVVFQFKDQDACLTRAGEVIPEKVDTTEGSKYSQLLRLKAAHLLAVYLLVYIGVEVTIGGWIVTFMRIVRGGGPSSGYIASGFWGGLTVGRVALIGVTEKLGEVRAIYVYISLTILCQLVVWLVPSLIVGAIAVSLIGVLLGPMYPVAISYTPVIIPRSLVTGTIGWISAVGATGSALLPFITGQIASKYGIESLQPFLVGMMVLMGTMWALVPKAPPTSS